MKVGVDKVLFVWKKAFTGLVTLQVKVAWLIFDSDPILSEQIQHKSHGIRLLLTTIDYYRLFEKNLIRKLLPDYRSCVSSEPLG